LSKLYPLNTGYVFNILATRNILPGQLMWQYARRSPRPMVLYWGSHWLCARSTHL